MDGSISKATFNLEIADGLAIVTREVAFKNGDSVMFSVGVDPSGLTIPEIHQRSVANLIKQLEAWSAPT